MDEDFNQAFRRDLSDTTSMMYILGNAKCNANASDTETLKSHNSGRSQLKRIYNQCFENTL